ncbi:acetyl-CoA acetyltransferase [Thermocatellispora tengchongensis]|uniref:Acetyl-CoA acetyltransferase n=1 Tax=Thermocatellispora tengchongensis TaxID=1073253 RepID=A0A840PTV1_9ACTN|nr:hypothetical protein [Thermocatellispora tengchongensis]MBB5140577.1 acetyl-CoA acetyltransferase [Thermocatellispora tengchongensis]
MNESVWPAGVGMTPFGLHEDRDVSELARAAIDEALRDSGLEHAQVKAARR